ncbi:MAG: Na+-transporting NADH:ubiquinone oxidoreductase subunit C, partial [Yoonia sp.]
MSAKKETLGKTVGVVVAVCFVCSIVVSSAAVGLRSLQETNAALDKKSNILSAAGLLDEATDKSQIAALYDSLVEEKFIELATGKYVDKPSVDFDMYKA